MKSTSRKVALGRFDQPGVTDKILTKHVVRSVTWNPNDKKFTVVAKDLRADALLPPETFDFVVNASGHFSVPNVPHFPGEN